MVVVNNGITNFIAIIHNSEKRGERYVDVDYTCSSRKLGVMIVKTLSITTMLYVSETSAAFFVIGGHGSSGSGLFYGTCG